MKRNLYVVIALCVALSVGGCGCQSFNDVVDDMERDHRAAIDNAHPTNRIENIGGMLP